MSLLKSKGEKNFNRCAHKDVVFRPRYYSDPNGSNSFREDIKGSTYGAASVSAHMTCPVTEGGEPVRTDKYWSSTNAPSSQEEARKNLGHVAGLTICGNCPFVDLSQIEVVERRIEIAEAEQRALLAEANLKHLRQQIADGKDVVTDLAPNGMEYTPQAATTETTE